MLTEQQLNERRLGIGGSDIAAIMGCDPWKTINDVYNEKLGVGGAKPTSLPMELGSYLEDFIGKKYAEENQDIFLIKIPTYVHPEKPHYRVNIDFEISPKLHLIDELAEKPTKSSIEKRAILECKTANAFTKKNWGESGSEIYPLHYRLQIAYYAAVMDVDYVDLMVLIGNTDLRTYRYTRNIELESHILNTVDLFWEHVTANKPISELQTSVDLEMYLGSKIDSNKDLPQFLINSYLDEHCKKYRILKKNIKDLESEIDVIREKIIEFMPCNSQLVSDKGLVEASFTSSFRTSFDQKKFKEEHGELYKQYQTKQTIVETFKVI
jgi:putative phage-type endonuclease